MWKSRKIRRVVKSTSAAEALALLEATESCFLLKSVLLEILGMHSDTHLLPIKAITDNKSLCDIIHSTRTMEDKRQKSIFVHYVTCSKERKYMKLNGWTKAGASTAKLLSVLCGEEKLI